MCEIHISNSIVESCVFIAKGSTLASCLIYVRALPAHPYST